MTLFENMSVTRLLTVLFASVVLVTFIVACGGNGKEMVGGERQVLSRVAGHSAITATEANRARGFKSDEDFDDHGDGNDDEPNDKVLSNSHRSDPDIDGDPLANKVKEAKVYYDGDDAVIRTYGHPADAIDRRVITALAQRYQAAAVASDGVRACSLMHTLFAEAIPEDYGADVGLASAHTTCAAVMTKLFARNHRKLTGAITITRVRVKGNRAQATMGSTTQPASVLPFERERGAWKVIALFPSPLP